MVDQYLAQHDSCNKCGQVLKLGEYHDCPIQDSSFYQFSFSYDNNQNTLLRIEQKLDRLIDILQRILDE
jgi:hypothetical protein